jgi:hypothetical protein
MKTNVFGVCVCVCVRKSLALYHFYGVWLLCHVVQVWERGVCGSGACVRGRGEDGEKKEYEQQAAGQ